MLKKVLLLLGKHTLGAKETELLERTTDKSM